MAVEFTLQSLHDEIEADPAGLGLKNGDGSWKGDTEIANLLNAKDFVIDRDNLEMELVRESTTYDAYNALAIDEQEWLRWRTAGDGFIHPSADFKAQLSGRALAVDGIAGAGNNSNSFWSAGTRNEIAPIMLALIEVAGSWAEVAWGEGARISPGQVGAAANL